MTQNDEPIALAKAFEELILGTPNPEQQQVSYNWVRGLPPELFSFGISLIAILNARESTSIETVSIIKELNMSSEDTNLNTGGGDVVGSAVGKGAKVDATTISNIKSFVDSNKNIDQTGTELFKQALDEVLAEGGLSDGIKEEIVGDIDKLQKQIANDSPDTGLIKKFCDGVKALGGNLISVVNLLAWVGDTFLTS